MKNLTIIGLVGAFVLIGLIVFLNRVNIVSRLSSSNSSQFIVSPSPEITQAGTASPPTVRTVVSKDIPMIATKYNFTVSVPEIWQAEAVEEINAINFYDPSLPESSSLEKSQIFIRYFEGDSFLTLSTVTIHSKQEQTINKRPAVRYDIEKKSAVPNFTFQPAWRSQRHVVTDIRVSDTNPSVFYVIAKRPDLGEETYQQFLQTLMTEPTEE